MADEKNDQRDELEEDEDYADVYTLTDEEGKEYQFEVIDEVEMDGTLYFAMVPVEETESEAEVWNYVVLKQVKDENGEDYLETLEDDDEFEKVAAYFDEQFSSDIDYDN